MGHCVDTRSACVSISILRHDAGFDFIDKPNRDRGEWKESAEIFRRGKFPLNPSDPAFYAAENDCGDVLHTAPNSSLELDQT
jgi:hypothetical protein